MTQKEYRRKLRALVQALALEHIEPNEFHSLVQALREAFRACQVFDSALRGIRRHSEYPQAARR